MSLDTFAVDDPILIYRIHDQAGLQSQIEEAMGPSAPDFTGASTAGTSSYILKYNEGKIADLGSFSKNECITGRDILW